MLSHKDKRTPKVQRHAMKHGITHAVKEVTRTNRNGVDVYELRVHDGYHQLRYRVERFGSRIFGRQLEAYLAKRQHLDFRHSKNFARKLLYSLPSFSDWATLMPGALALEPIHHPGLKRLPSGKRLDPITRRLFRHALDPVGVRTRTLVGGWIAHHYVNGRAKLPVRWLSLGGGTAASSMIMIGASGIDKSLLHYSNVDIDQRAIKIAKEITLVEKLNPNNIKLLVGDILNGDLLTQATGSKQVDIIELMGIFEYLDTDRAVKLLKLAYGLLKAGGILILSNMRIEHPELNVHKRGIGWPHVIPRKVDELLLICQQAGISNECLSVYQPKDGVYNVLRVRKP